MFTDSSGRAWRIYDYSVIAGRIVRHELGKNGAYRMFVPDDGGARRTYLFGPKDDHASTLELLERELTAAALYWKDDPDHYATMSEAGFVNAGGPERVDPVSVERMTNHHARSDR